VAEKSALLIGIAEGEFGNQIQHGNDGKALN
jgi:hypothetical protein